MVARPPDRPDSPDRWARLDRAQLRIARRVAGRLRDGGLVFVVGRDVRRRRAFEATLRDEGIVVSAGRLDLDGDPWDQILALARSGATPSVSWADGDSESFLATFNLGRERFAELRAGLLVWIGGLDAIETFPVQAPDLWAYRAGVEWVVSALDFRASLPTFFPLAASATERLRQCERELAGLSVDDPRRIAGLVRSTESYLDLDDPGRALELHAEAERIWATVNERAAWPSERSWLAESRASLALALGRRPPNDPDSWMPVPQTERAMHATTMTLLWPFDALGPALRRHVVIARADTSAELATDAAAPVVDGLLSLGLSTDAFEFVDALLSTPNLSDRRRLSLRVLRARALIAGGAAVLGTSELWLALDEYRTALTSAHPVSIARLSLAALDLITQDLVHLAPTPSEADELRELGLSLADAAEQTARAEHQHDWAHDLRSAAATLLLALGRHEDARARLEQNLAWSQQTEGPSHSYPAHLELARLDAAQGQPNRALVEIEQARRALESNVLRMQPHSAWRELLLEHARVLAAAGQPERGRVVALKARARMATADLPAEELATLHVLAEPLPGEGHEALPSREQAAAEALALAANSGLIDEEARALANFALIHAEQGRRAPASAMIAEARWLIEEHLYGRIRDHVDAVGARIDALLTDPAQ